MKKILVLLCTLTWSIAACALSGQAYMDRFNAYWAWSQQLPSEPDSDFIAFIQETGLLSHKLRDRWLYELARNQDWANFAKYYQYANDPNLVCFYQLAQYKLGKNQQVAKTAIPLWLTGNNTPQACNTLFDLLLAEGSFNQDMITQRIALALEKRNLNLARNLIKKYHKLHTKELQTLNNIARNPYAINQLTNGVLASDFYLYGLRRMISSNMKQAINYWSQSKTKKILNEAKQQAFLSQLVIYKAMRNNADASEWFMKIKPKYYTKLVLDWQIRYALKQRDWAKVIKLINNLEDKDNSCWQYWLARALEEQDQKQQAKVIYQNLASNRNYYGFLASRRLHTTPQFENEKPSNNPDTIKAYKPFIEEVKNLYLNKQTLQASRMLNDFISELPKEEASALVYWIDKDLHWYGKSVYLSNNETLNNQLILRFPLAYRETINHYSKQYQVAPELVYAIIRQESGFREDVTSSAGARGLMQVMPKTATVVSKADKIPYHDHRQLFSSQKNINIGVAYLRQLGKRFSAHPILIAASYNAGPKQVVHWLKDHPPKEIDIWIETLPWVETRNYLKNVLAFYVVYQYRLQQKPDLNPFLEPLSAR